MSSSSRNRTRARRRPDAVALLGAAGAAVALAGAGWYWYSTWAASASSSGSKSDGSASSSSWPSTSSSASPAQRPTLSLLVPKTMPPASLSLLYEHLVAPLAAHYNIHLILSTAAEPPPSVDGLDERRILRYSTRKGALSVARALGCDGHVEVLADEQDDDDNEESLKALHLVRKNGKCRLFVLLEPPSREAFASALSSSEAAGPGAALRIVDTSTQSIEDCKRAAQRLIEFRSAWR